MFVAENEREFGVKDMCKVLDVSRSGYYAWVKRKPCQHGIEDKALEKLIKEIYAQGRRKYGSPRVQLGLRNRGHRHGRKRIARLMTQNGLYGRKRRRFVVTTKADPQHRHAKNVLNREFSAKRPNLKWVSDITQIPTKEGALYLAATIDLYSRKVVGWAMDHHMEASLTRRSLSMAIEARQPHAKLLHHSDRGSQYSDAGFRADLKKRAAVQSMSRRANVWDNAVMESFFATLQKELLVECKLESRSRTTTEVFEWIETFYNRVRIHSTLGGISPKQFEDKHWHGVSAGT